MGRKHYGADKIGRTKALLVSNAGYIKPTALAENVSRDTVSRWSEGKYPEHVTPEQVQAETAKASEELADLWEKVATLGAQTVLLRLESDPKLSGYHAALIGAIGTDKANLLRGRATERVEVLDFASWLRSQRTASGTPSPRAEAQPASDVAKPN